MEMIEVKSSMIKSVGYDEKTSRLVIVFLNGHVYEFNLVPRSVFHEFLTTESKGKFFMERLKSSPYGHRFTKLQ
jgi:hypothetical protein